MSAKAAGADVYLAEGDAAAAARALVGSDAVTAAHTLAAGIGCGAVAFYAQRVHRAASLPLRAVAATRVTHAFCAVATAAIAHELQLARAAAAPPGGADR